MREVRRLRQERGWNQTELAFHAGLAPSVISQIETGKRDPSAATLRKLADALSVGVPELFEGAQDLKGQAPLPFETPEDEEAREWRLLGYVRSWILLLDNLSERWEKAAEHGSFSPEVYMEFGETFESVNEAVKSIMEGLKRHQGIDPLEGAIGLMLRESLVRWARAFKAVNKAFIETYGENDLARRRRQQAETLQYEEAADERENVQNFQSTSAG
jgi:transcriptional regulator with XRE-family HTH domain